LKEAMQVTFAVLLFFTLLVN